MEKRAASMAISCMWVWMIPHFFIEYTEYRLAVEKVSLSEAWNHDESNDDGNDKPSGSSPRETANKAIVVGVWWAIGIIGVVYLGSAISIGTVTAQPSGQVLTKPDAIAIGVGRMLSSCLLAYFSILFPRWLGVTYSSHKHVYCYKQMHLEPSAKSNKELSFRVCWSFLGHFFVMYPFLVAYFCNESFKAVVLSTGVGTTFGFAVFYFVWLGHTKLSCRNRTRIAIALSVTIAVSSAAAFSAGCWFVKEVWYDNNEYTDENIAATFFVWLAMCLLAHCVYYRLTQRKLAEAKVSRAGGTPGGDDTVIGDASEIASVRRDEVELMKGEWRYQSQVFQPPKSISCTELSKSLTILPALMKIGRKPHPRQQQQPRHQSDDSNVGVDTKKTSNAKIGNDIQPLPESPVQHHDNADGEIMLQGLVIDHVVEEKVVDQHASNLQTYSIATIATKKRIATTKKRVHVKLGENFTTDGTIESVECGANVNPSSSAATSDIETNDEIRLGTEELVSTAHIDDSVDEEDSLSAESIKEQEIPTLWFMMKANSCCRRRRYYQAPHRKGCSRFVKIFKWTLWALACGWHLTFTIINIGASYQQNKVRGALHGTYEKIYPPNYTTGSMCAWNESSLNADIRTFESLQDVVDTNYTVIHCGECGYCSNWNDLSLQWTTRDHLAQKAKDCVTKSILGSREDVQECNEDTIGFTEECSLCWTIDQYCARDNCMFIFLQSVLTNQVNNFHVGPDDITSATCDEALCGPGFVPCSGATRRRMNIVSKIPRPISQQCGVAFEDWSRVFDHP